MNISVLIILIISIHLCNGFYIGRAGNEWGIIHKLNCLLLNKSGCKLK